MQRVLRASGLQLDPQGVAMPIGSSLLHVIHQVRINGNEVQLDEDRPRDVRLTVFSSFGTPEFQTVFGTQEEAQIARQLATRFLTEAQTRRLLKPDAVLN
jgi:hypothetical protein